MLGSHNLVVRFTVSSGKVDSATVSGADSVAISSATDVSAAPWVADVVSSVSPQAAKETARTGTAANAVSFLMLMNSTLQMGGKPAMSPREALLPSIRCGNEHCKKNRNEGHEDECGEPESDGERRGLVVHNCPVAGDKEEECEDDGTDSKDCCDAHSSFASSQSSGVVISGSQPK